MKSARVLSADGERSERPKAAFVFERFETDDIAEAARIIRAKLAGSAAVGALGDRSAFAMRLQILQLGALRVGLGDFSNFWLALPCTEVMTVSFGLDGTTQVQSGSRAPTFTRSRFATVGRPNETLRLDVLRGRVIGLCLPVRDVALRAGRLTGEPHRERLLSKLFDRIDLLSPIGAALSRNMKLALSEAGSLNSTGLGSLASSALEDLLLNLAAAALFPGVTVREGKPPPDCGLATIRRARDFIRAHSSEPLHLSRVARELGISMRSMQETFRKHVGLSPREFLFTCRLEDARERLLAPEMSTSVTEVAYLSGFMDLGQFAAKYREMFLELPSETLASSKLRLQ